jgi:hypothetical protein
MLLYSELLYLEPAGNASHPFHRTRILQPTVLVLHSTNLHCLLKRLRAQECHCHSVFLSDALHPCRGRPRTLQLHLTFKQCLLPGPWSISPCRDPRVGCHHMPKSLTPETQSSNRPNPYQGCLVHSWKSGRHCLMYPCVYTCRCRESTNPSCYATFSTPMVEDD